MADESSVLVFAYGSNLHKQRMLSRVSTAVPVTIGCVRQRRFVYHKKSLDGSAKADAASVESLDEQVWGVVYRLQRRQKQLLDRFEFLGTGYDEQQVEVVHQTGILSAWMYVARPSAIDATLLPYSWYHDLVVAGAIQHRLPRSYVKYLRSFEATDDPDDRRHAEHARLIGP